jgi:hypothetical protein
MTRLLVLVMSLLVAAPALGAAQSAAPPPDDARRTAPAGRDAIQHGAQPDPGAVRPGNRDGDAPSASVGTLRPEERARILGFPVNAVLVIAGVLVLIAAVGAVAVPRARRSRRVQGNGSW